MPNISTVRLRSRSLRPRSPIDESLGESHGTVLDEGASSVARPPQISSLVRSASSTTSNASATNSVTADTSVLPTVPSSDHPSASAASSQSDNERNQPSAVIAQIEEIFEAVIVAVEQGTQLSLPLPAVIRILEIAHEALLTGKLVTKRNIFYQDKQLFRDQRTVDALVDNIALTLGVGRHALNIAAAGKGLVAGPISLTLDDDGSILPCDDATLIPTPDRLRHVEWSRAQWILVIEKEGKGYPDLCTRRFLFSLHQSRPYIPVYGLVDYDPYGIRILRNYQRGSANLQHERDCTVSTIHWLGIRLADIRSYHVGIQEDIADSTSQTQASTHPHSSQGQDSQIPDTLPSQPSSRTRSAVSRQSAFEANTASLSNRDRKVALETLRSLPANENDEDGHYLGELQVMLMLNVKAEIQAVDNLGDITTWLDSKLCME
ncbi:meiosis-specific topoisomerase Spo11 [Gaeumannomyces tritici R3-111a-1]|uniref:DNA topoisomerase (ATP-hydrolyzing) n=1 Tax=Gaeumannomyces tritici (strain R3-111a-1) TaxID=644352 RepID=J3NXT9_GAET3|nr:meiosis-specific topoisomerase Spo11 [Gaeumannomyces tritici R3-111a-1]EJT76172.1 meiosis-specific topoisomerase Spo11 [Gaeumannomyces tritici R3-111a-1]